ncbi:uncharacterized protein LOC110748423, partial [Prunus avium]|uniref:Uncharacterized protein LOC110748423 n=1 Tax=Prunus avium TaxID=42229 RepID=A0A6P5RGX1_PRUAV
MIHIDLHDQERIDISLNPNKSKALQAGIPLFPTDAAMDLVSSLECQKSDAQSVGLDKDRCQKDLFWPDIPCISDLSIRGNSIVINKKGGGKVPCPPEMVPLDRDTSPLLKPGCPVGNKGEEPVEEKCEPPKSNLRVPTYPLRESKPKADPDSTYIPFIQLPRPI